MLMTIEERFEKAETIMEAFAQRSGLKEGGDAARRYLWTDAFAVCNFLSLYGRSGDGRYLDLARRLIDEVHRVLGRFRDDDVRRGALGGLLFDATRVTQLIAGHGLPLRGMLRALLEAAGAFLAAGRAPQRAFVARA